MIDFGSTIINTILGALIMAFASSLHLYLQGKITGISGAIYKMISLTDFSYNSSFLIGMLFMSSFLKCFFDPLAKPKTVDSPTFLETPSKYVGDLSFPGFLLAGFLVGFGAKMANGCTSGHGICGLPRLSKRSIVAIILFMIFGIMMATIRYYIPFLRPISYAFNVWESSFLYYLMLFLSIAGFGLNLWNSFKSGIKDKVRDIVISFLIGALFSYGLIQSGMTQRHIVLEFLTIGRIWSIQLAVLLGVVVGINFITFNFILKKITRPRYKEKYDLPTSTEIDNKLCVGSAIFGLGWGLGGICPGPAILSFYLYCPQMLAFLISLCCGMYVESVFDKKISGSINNNEFLLKVNKFRKFEDTK
jgi:uncharacterized membrane protein YedE/YeeE